ncbi:hypothetical protein F0223_23520 [Vibrio coralliilyticus]|jgi:hypothetical protein|uniref:hypothetical protein n=1 Tax=Vibrio TaxID=662 RepID=UPI000505F604|nr:MULTISPECIES: hypothetical protein [Vibrio]KFI12073.1 cysteinyl-tRNA synthetase [Vibrio sp. B183]NOI21175.1 hypothetical protein [Vibrio coralliilyticus]
MARSYPLQSSLQGKLEQDFKKFRDRERLSDAEAARQLLTLALRIKLNDSDDDRPSNRELMEEMYRRIRQIQGTSNLTHTQSFDGAAFYKNKQEAGEMRNLVTADVNNKVDAFLEGEKKG